MSDFVALFVIPVITVTLLGILFVIIKAVKAKYDTSNFNAYFNNTIFGYHIPTDQGLQYAVYFVNIANHSYKNPTMFTDGHIHNPSHVVWFVNKKKITDQDELISIIEKHISAKYENVGDVVIIEFFEALKRDLK